MIARNTNKYRINADRREDCTELAILEAGTWAPRSVLRIPNDDAALITGIIEVLQEFLPAKPDHKKEDTQSERKKESNRIAKR